MKKKHTSGPWKYDGHRMVIGGDWGRVICGSLDSEHKEDVANAHLIAAAPEMLQALETIVKKLQAEGDSSNALGRCMNAINKAKGES